MSNCPTCDEPGCAGCFDYSLAVKARPHSPDNPLSPSHYVAPNGLELRMFIAHLPYYRGAAIKYVFRAGRKPGEDLLKDLRKARESIDIEIERLEKEKT